MNFFGRRAEPAVKPRVTASSSPGDGSAGGAVSSLKNTMETLGKRQSYLETLVKAENKKALEFKRKGNKKAALLCLKKKKMYEKEIEKIAASTFNIEQQVITLESSQTNVEIINTQREFKVAMERVSKQINVDKVAEMQDDIQEQMSMQDEVQELLGQSFGQLEDEDDLLGELDELMKEEEEIELNMDVLTIGSQETVTVTGMQLPSVPSGMKAGSDKKAEPDEDEAALKELEAEMAM